MKKEDIRQLASLSRIAVTDNEVDNFQAEIGSILEYVGQIQAMTNTVDGKKVPGAVYNKMRLDEVVHEPGTYTEAILRELPARDGNFMKVKKILATDE
ncbi:MAG: Asp-tRNA(Asn)/Glu-tRNA(Gln) amidotransferase subunit GatC [Candidatus Paceibacteria bacterium]